MSKCDKCDKEAVMGAGTESLCHDHAFEWFEERNPDLVAIARKQQQDHIQERAKVLADRAKEVAKNLTFGCEWCDYITTELSELAKHDLDEHPEMLGDL